MLLVPLDDVQYRLVACRSNIFGDAAILDSGTCEIVESYALMLSASLSLMKEPIPMNSPEQSRDSKPNEGSDHKDADRTVFGQTNP
jgi:hypothetical protein